MVEAARARLLLLDATVPHRFCDAQLLPQLIRYLPSNAWITPEVEDELRRSARSYAYAGLLLLERAGWPQTTAVLPPPVRKEFELTRRAVQQPNDPPEKHIGEIATVLMAADLKADLVILEDDLGKRLAKKKGLTRISTAQLALEMVEYGALTDAEGLVLFDLSSGHAGEAVFRQRLKERGRPPVRDE
jgi:hypothetical protein